MFETNMVAIERKIKDKISDTSTKELKEMKLKNSPGIAVGWKEQWPDKPIRENIETYEDTPLTDESIKTLIKEELRQRK